MNNVNISECLELNKRVKLVRDKIPSLFPIDANPHVVAVGGDDYPTRLYYLLQKVLEEAAEVRQTYEDDAHKIVERTGELFEEIADLYEVLDALREHVGFTDDYLDLARKKKLREKGGFSEFFLLYNP